MPKGTPTYLTQNPDGTVSADFSGHVFAAGVDLLANSPGSPAADRRIAWHKNTKNGAVVAQVFGDNYVPGGGGDISDAYLYATDQNAIHSASLQAQSTSSGPFAGSQAKANADSQTALIIDNNGNSDFVKKGVYLNYGGGGADFHIPNDGVRYRIKDGAGNTGNELGYNFSLDKGWWQIGANLLVGADSANWTTIIACIELYTVGGGLIDPNLSQTWAEVNQAAAAPGTGNGWVGMSMGRPAYNDGTSNWMARLIVRTFGAFGGYVALAYPYCSLYAYRIG